MSESTQVAKAEAETQITTKYQEDWWAPKTFADASRMAERMAKAQLVPPQYRGKPDDILVAWSLGSPLGLSLLSSLQHIAVVNGKPSIYGDAAMAVCRAHPACRSIHEELHGEGDDMVAVCTVVRAGESKPIVRQFSVEDAKTAKKWGAMDCKPESRAASPWVKYPRRMLQMRARSWALRDAFADAMCGMPITEELRDITEEVVVRNAEPEPQGATATERLKNRIKPPAPEPEAKPDAGEEPPMDLREDLLFRFRACLHARSKGDDEKESQILEEIEESVGEPVEEMPTGELEKLVVQMEKRVAERKR